jgi:hypothetical protein
MPRTVPKISACAGAGENAIAQMAKAKTIPEQSKNLLSFIFTLTRVESRTTTLGPASNPVEHTFSMSIAWSAREGTRRGNQGNRGNVREE